MGLARKQSWALSDHGRGLRRPYEAGSTDIGAGIMYPIIFVGLFLASAGLFIGLDSKLRTKLSRRFGWTTST